MHFVDTLSDCGDNWVGVTVKLRPCEMVKSDATLSFSVIEFRTRLSFILFNNSFEN